MGDKQSIAEFIKDLREQVDVPASMSDAAIMKAITNKRPDVLKGLETSEARPKMKTEDPGVMSGMGRELKETGKALVNPETYKGMGKHFLLETMGGIQEGERKKHPDMKLDNPWLDTLNKGAENDPRYVFGNKGKIDKAKEEDHPREAFGRAVTEGLMLAAPFKKAGAPPVSDLEAMLNLGKHSIKEEGAMNAAKMLTRETSAALEKTISGIDQSLSKQLSNVSAIRKAIAKPMKLVNQLERAPNAQVKDVAAAKDILTRMNTRVQKGMLPWGDLREMYKEIGNASDGLTKGSSQLRTALNEIRTIAKDELAAGAKAGGQGAQFDKWLSDYAKLSQTQRAYVRIAKGATPSQLEAGAKATPGVTIPRTGIKMGGKGAAKAATKEIGAWHKAAKELHESIAPGPPSAGAKIGQKAGQLVNQMRGKGGGQPPPSAPPPATPPPAPPAGGGAPGSGHGAVQQTNYTPPPTQAGAPVPQSGPAGPVAPGAGTFSRTPRQNPLEFPTGAAPMPPKPNLPPEIQSILDKMNKGPF